MIAICRRNALWFSDAVCRLRIHPETPFHPYFDWSDHIAAEGETDYPYHLNKTAEGVTGLVRLFRPCFSEIADFAGWVRDWYRQTVAAAWIHDIGMLEERNLHGQKSAAFVLDNDTNGFDFSGIDWQDRLKIGLLCIRHHQAWPTVYAGMRQLLADRGHDPGQVDLFFERRDSPEWELDFSGKLLATADAVRYRGLDLRNDLRQRFEIWSRCSRCERLYAGPMPFCETEGCAGGSMTPIVVVPFDFPAEPYEPERMPEIMVYRNVGGLGCDRVATPITGQRLHVVARSENQWYTLGDMALSNIHVEDALTWRQGLGQAGIDCSVLDDCLLTAPEAPPATPFYRTVVHVGLNTGYPEAALLSFVNYIALYLDENLTTDESGSWLPSSGTLLDIRLSGGQRLAGLMEAVRRDGLQKLREAALPDPVHALESTCERWRKHKRVLPVEVVDGRVETIQP